MSSGFADVLSLLGVWLGGRKAAVPPPLLRPTVAGGGRGIRHDVRYAFVDPDIEDMVRRALDHLSDERQPPPAERPRIASPDPVPASDADIAEAIDRLFTAPMLAALDEKRRAAARSATTDAIRASEMWALEEARVAALAARIAQEQDQEDAILALLLA